MSNLYQAATFYIQHNLPDKAKPKNDWGQRGPATIVNYNDSEVQTIEYLENIQEKEDKLESYFYRWFYPEAELKASPKIINAAKKLSSINYAARKFFLNRNTLSAYLSHIKNNDTLIFRHLVEGLDKDKLAIIYYNRKPRKQFSPERYDTLSIVDFWRRACDAT